VARLEADAFRVLNDLPDSAVAALRPLMALATLPGAAVVTVAALVTRRRLVQRWISRWWRWPVHW
jgi:hypothetical protein